MIDTLIFIVAALVASLANAATYEWAWNRRRISPWQPTPEGVARRSWLDCLPIVGWVRLRRDAGALGAGFWVRPMVVEALFAVAMVGLFAWEVEHRGLITPQEPLATTALALSSPWQGYLLHFVLAGLMLVATLIDLDEKTIPDQITVPGMLIALLLATLFPYGHLPNVEERLFRPAVAEPLKPLKGPPLVGVEGAPIYVEPTHVNAPNEWPTSLDGGQQNHRSLLLGLGCFGLWCFALTPRYWRTRRGVLFGLVVLLRRAARELRLRPLREILIGGVLAITCVWFTGGAAWQGLLTALVGMVVSGAMVWAVRIVGSAALGREAMGFGDVTLMFMVGAFLGWQAGLTIFFLAPFAALIIGLLQLVLRREDEIPYGPFLCLAAAFVVVRWGDVWRAGEVYFSMGAVLPVVLVVCLGMLGVLLAIWRQFKLRVLGISEDWDDEVDPA
ncbi:Type 4 prepilin-like proteins leader peptide-processing enzyme [Planctomycetes bacterium MalM25]|nr:Type 4 prepilin-like proteins leader peptide-processing enzyme [Planctomycetes bacterium MalM25]